MKPRRSVSGAGKAFIVAASLATLSWFVTRASRENERAAGEIAALREELGRLRVSRIQAPVVVREVNVASSEIDPVREVREAQSEVVPARSRPTRTVQENDRYFKAVNEAQQALLVKEFERDRFDASWGASAKASLEALYANAGFTGLTTRVDCRSTLCRVEFSYADPKQGVAAVRQLMAKRPWSGKAYTHYDTETMTGYSYVAREGFPFPVVDPKSLAL